MNAIKPTNEREQREVVASSLRVPIDLHGKIRNASNQLGISKNAVTILALTKGVDELMKAVSPQESAA